AADLNGAATSVRVDVATVSLRVTVNNAVRVYGQPNPVFTTLDSGFVSGDTPSSLSGSLTFNTNAVASSDVGSFDVTASGLSSSNYTINYVKGSLTITPANQTIVWNNPADITFGTRLGPAQLNATVTVPGPAPAGKLTYTPGAGTNLAVGSGQSLTVTA